MEKLIRRSLMLAFPVLVTHTNLTAQPKDTKIPDAEVQAITRVNKQYGEAFAKNDSSLFIDCYASDACILAPNAPALCGEKRQLLFYKAAYGTGMRNIVFTTANWYGYTGEFVTEQGTYQQLNGENKVIGTGKYLVVWQKLAKGWKMLRDMFNTDSSPKM